MIDDATLGRLLEPASCAVSIYLPIDPEQRDQRAPDAKLRTAIGTADAMLERRGMELRQRGALLEPLHGFAAGADFARHRDPGLALFVRHGGPDGSEPPVMERIGLPTAMADQVVIGHDMHIKPLLPLAARNRRFSILALSRSRVRLLSATPFTVKELKLDTLPAEVQAELDSLTGPAADMPGAGAPDASTERDAAFEALLVAEPRRIATAVRAALREDTAPLVLAADPHVAGRFLQDVQIRQMHPQPLHLNPFAMTDTALRDAAMELLRPILSAEIDDFLDRVTARLGTAERSVAIRLEEILNAAREGRVDQVAVAEDEALWGQLSETGAVLAHGTPGPRDQDLLNQAAILAMRTGGRAFALPHDRLPRGVLAAATLRF